jgi:hypothetical protein
LEEVVRKHDIQALDHPFTEAHHLFGYRGRMCCVTAEGMQGAVRHSEGGVMVVVSQEVRGALRRSHEQLQPRQSITSNTSNATLWMHIITCTDSSGWFDLI